MVRTCVGFSKLEILRSCLIDIDTGTLVCVCALYPRAVFNTDGEFQGQIISMNLLYK